MNKHKKITISNFDNVRDRYPKEAVESIEQFIERFKTVESKKLTKEEFHNLSNFEQRKEKDGRGYCFATFGNHLKENGASFRNDENVLSLSGIAIDVDNKETNEPLTVADVKKKFKNIFYIIHPTHSSTEAQHRFRVIFLFKEPIEPSQYADVFQYFLNEFGGKNDKKVKDKSRLFYYPSCPKGEEKNYYVHVNKDGELFDVSTVIGLTKHDKKQLVKKRKRQATASDHPEFHVIDLGKLKIDRVLKKLIISGYKDGDFTSRSEHAFYCITELLKINIPLETIFCIIANKNYAVNEHYDSKSQVWKDICRIAESSKKTRYGVVIGTEPSFPRPEYKNPDEISKSIKHDIEVYVRKQRKACNYSLGIKAPAGIGKTEAVIEKICNMVMKDGAYIEVYLPSNDLAVEFKERIGNDIAVNIIHGRTSEHAPEYHCIKRKSVGNLSKAGLGIPSLLCRNKDGSKICAAHNDCNYLKQYKTKRSVTIYNHKHLFLERNNDEKNRKPDLIIIDESFYKSSLDEVEIKMAEVEGLIVDDLIKRSLSTMLPYDYLKTKLDDPQQFVEDELSRLQNERNNLIGSITPTTLPEKTNKISKKAGRFYKSIILLETMRSDYERIENGKLPIFLYRREHNESFLKSSEEKEAEAWHCVQKHKDLVRLFWGEEESKSLIPTVYIDADLDQTIANVFFKDIRLKTYAAKRNAKTWQLLSTTNAIKRFYNKQDSERYIEQVQRQIEYACKKFKNDNGIKNVLIVTYKKLLDDNKFNIPENCHTIHFGDLRGLDIYKDCEACIVIGRFQLPYDAIDRNGIGLWHDCEEELLLKQHIVEERGYRIKNDKKLGIPVSLPKDPRLQALALQTRECETLQAIDRLRLMFNDEKKSILILSNVPLDIDIDQYVFYKLSVNKINSILQKAENNVITLRSDTLFAQYPKKFNKIGHAKKIIERWKDLFLNDDGEALIGGVKHKQTKYSLNPKGGRPSYCLHKMSTSKAIIIAALKKIHGVNTIKLLP